MFGDELRASAAGGCGPQTSNEVDLLKISPQPSGGCAPQTSNEVDLLKTSPQPSGRACNEQREEAALRPGGGCGLPVAPRPNLSAHATFCSGRLPVL